MTVTFDFSLTHDFFDHKGSIPIARSKMAGSKSPAEIFVFHDFPIKTV
jgi:hypothetical protein